jgi:UDP-N-acetylmuramoylalanine--D-glutamate ligase
MTQNEIRGKFEGKKITLMGLGLLGRGIGDAEFFAAAGAELIITDLKTEAELVPALSRLKPYAAQITYHLGGHQLEDFEQRDMIIRAPNAPLDSPFLAHARAAGVPIEMDASLFAKLAAETTSGNTTIVGVTGTRGKTTTTHLIYEMAKAAGKNPLLGGNEKDTATLQLLDKVTNGGLVILELDSWQLQGFEESKISPHVAVWTNFLRDHMNYYHDDMDRYFEDKAAIARFQKRGDIFITTSEILQTMTARFGAPAGRCITDAALPEDWVVTLPGEHNRANAAYARATAQCLGIPDEIIKNVLKTFTALPDRLQLLGEKNGIEFYNDSTATTPDATIAALKALAGKQKPIVLIAGGSDKSLVFDDLVREINITAASVILFKGTAQEKLQALLDKKFMIPLASNMQEAFTAALGAARTGSIILLSPGATSFGIFKNEYDRGDQFSECFKNLK